MYTTLGNTCAGLVLALASFSVSATLIGRLETTPGSGVYQAYYDTDQDITWTTDANINGIDGIANHQSWVASLNIGGVTGWRLPTMDINGDGFAVNCSAETQANCLDNELGYLAVYGSPSGISPGAPGPFTNIATTGGYWSTSQSPTNSDYWAYNFSSGSNIILLSEASGIAWAVHDGDVGALSAVPVPAAVWLFGSGLLGLAGIGRRKQGGRPSGSC